MDPDTGETGNRVSLGWRLRVIMAERRIPTATGLGRLLAQAGHQITSSQLSRILDNRPDRINMALLEALLTVLQCSLDDLMPMAGASPHQEVQKPPGKGDKSARQDPPPSPPTAKPNRKRAEPLPHGQPEEELLGPKLAPFPLPSKK